MNKLEEHNLKHEVANSIAAIRMLAKTNTIFIKRAAKEYFNSIQPKHISLVENSMQTIQKELFKIEKAFEKIF